MLDLKFQYQPCKTIFTVLMVICGFNSETLLAQADTLWLKNDNVIFGELKEMKQNVADFSTDYSDSDFKIKWNEIKRIKTTTQYLISMSSGPRYNGRLQSSSNQDIYIINNGDTLAKTSISAIVSIRKLDDTFWGNLNASISVGYNFTKANDLSQFSVRSNISYRDKRWSFSTGYNQILSSQSDADRTQRLDANLGYNYYFDKNWFALTAVNWLSNTAQNIDLRTLGTLGIGKYLSRTNSLYWAVQTGLSYNNESFNVDSINSTNNSAEAFLGSEINLYNMGDLRLLSRAVVYPSLTESGRWRTDFTLDLKYDLPFDLFLNLGLSLNYDNQPVQSGAETDYVFQTTVGWSL